MKRYNPKDPKQKHCSPILRACVRHTLDQDGNVLEMGQFQQYLSAASTCRDPRLTWKMCQIIDVQPTGFAALFYRGRHVRQTAPDWWVDVQDAVLSFDLEITDAEYSGGKPVAFLEASQAPLSSDGRA